MLNSQILKTVGTKAVTLLLAGAMTFGVFASFATVGSNAQIYNPGSGVPGVPGYVPPTFNPGPIGTSFLIQGQTYKIPAYPRYTTSYYTSVETPPNSVIRASKDMNFDGFADLIWQNTVNFTVSIWYLNGQGKFASNNYWDGRVASDTVNVGTAGAGWTVVAAGDLSNDGRNDILFRNTSGENVIWILNSANQIGGGYYIASAPDTNFKAVDMADTDTDGVDDIVWRHAVTGQNVLWRMNSNGTIKSGGYLPSFSDFSYDLYKITYHGGTSFAMQWYRPVPASGSNWYMTNLSFTSGATTTSGAVYGVDYLTY